MNSKVIYNHWRRSRILRRLSLPPPKKKKLKPTQKYIKTAKYVKNFFFKYILNLPVTYSNLLTRVSKIQISRYPIASPAGPFRGFHIFFLIDYVKEIWWPTYPKIIKKKIIGRFLDPHSNKTDRKFSNEKEKKRSFEELGLI